MLNFPPAVRIWLGTAPVDLRRSFDGLAEQVRQHLHNDPLSGHVFVFRNKRGDRIKLLYWDEDGFVIVYKRLEEGTFRWPAVAAGQPSVALRAAEWPCSWTASTGPRPSAAGATSGRRPRRVERVERVEQAGGTRPPAFFLRSREQIRSVIRHISMSRGNSLLLACHRPPPSTCPTTWPRSSAWSWNCWPRYTSNGMTTRLRHRIDLLLRRLYGPRGDASTPTNPCCSRSWPQATTRQGRPNRARRRNPSGVAGPTAAAACRRTCPASPGITSCPRPNASARAAARCHRYRHGPERTTRLSAGVVVRDRALRPQVRLPVLQPTAARSGTATLPRSGVRADAVAATRTPAGAGADSQ